MSGRSKLGAGLRAEIEQGNAAPAPEAPSLLQARQGRPVRGETAEGEGKGAVRRPRAVLASGERRKAVVAYFHRDVSLWLKQLAAKEETTVNALVGEAIDLLCRARGSHPFGER